MNRIQLSEVTKKKYQITFRKDLGGCCGLFDLRGLRELFNGFIYNESYHARSVLTPGLFAMVQTSPRLIDAPLLEDESSVAVACGARHSVVLTGTHCII